MTQVNIYTTIESKLRELMKNHNVGGHGVDHMIAVMNHAKAAVTCEDLPDYIKEKIILAALLHDADDPKIFKDDIVHNNDTPEISKDDIGYKNARLILNESLTSEFLLPLMEHDPNSDESAITQSKPTLEPFRVLGVVVLILIYN
jgi:HD superfamily phosphodiesterase